MGIPIERQTIISSILLFVLLNFSKFFKELSEAIESNSPTNSIKSPIHLKTNAQRRILQYWHPF